MTLCEDCVSIHKYAMQQFRALCSFKLEMVKLLGLVSFVSYTLLMKPTDTSYLRTNKKHDINLLLPPVKFLLDIHFLS